MSTAFHHDTLQELCALRRGLLKHPRTDAAVLLRAAALGCLHGLLCSTRSYFSNQMPRTFAAPRAIRSIDDPAVPADFFQGAPWLELLAASNSARNIS